jgi:uncharacterized Fe-S center protein
MIPISNLIPVIVKNRGTGAGGANTNKTGLAFEKVASIMVEDLEERGITGFLNVSGAKLHKMMKEFLQKNMIPAPGCKKPDEAFLNVETKRIFIIEKKMQTGGGSVEEKIQTGAFKQHHYSTLYPGYRVQYMYCLANWFKKEEHKSAIEYLKQNNVPVFWGEDSNYKDTVLEFMLSSL